MTLGKYLANNRIAHAVFAERIGVSQAAVTRYASGRRMPRPDVLRRIREVTEGAVEANDFMAGPDSEASAAEPDAGPVVPGRAGEAARSFSSS